jgi:hypothetical protein
MKTKVTKRLKNKKMDSQTYSERSKVMQYIRMAKSLLKAEGVNLPRIDVRITEHGRELLGLARMNDNIIWIPETTVNRPEILKHVVFHEILHACYGIKHYNDCPLMAPVICKDSQLNYSLDKIFIKYILPNFS